MCLRERLLLFFVSLALLTHRALGDAGVVEDELWEEILLTLDSNLDGKVSFEELLHRIGEEADDQFAAQLSKAFEQADVDKNKHLTKAEIGRFFELLSEITQASVADDGEEL